MDEHTPDPNQLEALEDVVISVRNIGKMYPLYGQPRDRLKQSIKEALPKSVSARLGEYYRPHWALHDVSFDLRRGETLGIIGKNGSGKSTLLQIVTGTLAPTNGEVWMRGHVAALLELGSGFNKEFTGRENVYMNGSILGLSKEEIGDRFDDIAAYADIGRFIDQPVKLYSSGMHLRLAFAVQAFVPKEIFVVDEALSVGDVAFQRKCLASLERFREDGGTVLLVSHNLQTIIYQCDRCILLHEGAMVVDGKPKPVTDLYQRIMYSQPDEVSAILEAVRENGLEAGLKLTFGEDKHHKSDGTGAAESQSQPNAEGYSEWFDPNMPVLDEVVYGSGDAEIIDFGMYDKRGQLVNVLVMGETYRWSYVVRFKRDVAGVQFGMLLKRVDGLPVSSITSKQHEVQIDQIAGGTIIEASFELKMNLVPGTYYLNSGVDGWIDGKHTYLQRRVDISMVRVEASEERRVTGIAYLEQSFSYNIVQES